MSDWQSVLSRELLADSWRDARYRCAVLVQKAPGCPVFAALHKCGAPPASRAIRPESRALKNRTLHKTDRRFIAPQLRPGYQTGTLFAETFLLGNPGISNIFVQRTKNLLTLKFKSLKLNCCSAQ